MEKFIKLDEQDIIQVFANHFHVDRAKICLKIENRTEGYGPTERQVPSVSAIIQEE